MATVTSQAQNTMPKRVPFQVSLTSTEKEMVEVRALCEGLSQSAFVARIIGQDWHATHAHLGPAAIRNMLTEAVDTSIHRRRIKTAAGRFRKVVA